jgi:hypothetical protein
MSTPAALPPHTEQKPGGFDVDADVSALSGTPKEQYEAPEQEPEPEAPKTEAPGGEQPGAQQPEGGGEGEGAPGVSAKESAREFLEVYDTLQSYGFHFYSLQGMPAEKFQLPKFAKDRAVHHLAKGLEKMGSPEVPWWIGLLIALAPPAGINFMAAKAYRDEGERQEAAARQERDRSNMHVVHPTTIIHPDGSERPAPAQRPVHKAAPRNTAPMPHCAQCGQPVKHRKGKYCSQSCSGKARAQFYKEQKSTPPAPAANA